MSYELSWYIPQRVLFVRLTGELDLDDIEAMALDSKAMIEQGIAPIHILLDDTQGGEPPRSLSEIKVRMEVVKNTRLGWVVAIGEVHPIAKFLVPLLMKITRVNFVRRSTLDHAVQFLMQTDSTLENLSHNG